MGAWDMIETWWIDRETPGHTIPNEAAIGILLGPDPTISGYHPSRISQYDNNLVVAFGYSVDTRRRMYRIYMEYVGHDSLSDIIRNQRAPRFFGYVSIDHRCIGSRKDELTYNAAIRNLPKLHPYQNRSVGICFND